MRRQGKASPREVKPPVEAREQATILLVEDEPLIVSLYVSVLKKLTEARIITATEEHEALELIARELPRIVLLDLMIPTTMPHGGQYGFHEPVGFEILRKVKSDPKTQHIHVIVITNLDADEHRLHAEELGAEEYIVKALLQPRELADRIARYLSE